MRILKLHEKQDTRLFVLKSVPHSEPEALELQRLALYIFQERDADEGWYDDTEMTELEKRYYTMAKTGDTKAALTFLLRRSREGYEYEDCEVIDSEEWE